MTESTETKTVTKIVKLAFDPDQAFGEVWADDITRTLWLLWRPEHIVEQGFEDRCHAVAARIRERQPRTAFELVQCFPRMSQAWTEGDVVRFADEYLPYFTGEKTVGWSVHR